MSAFRKLMCIVLVVTIAILFSGCGLLVNNSQPAKTVADNDSIGNDKLETAEVTVSDALNYEKDVIIAPEYAANGAELSGLKHKICIPKINAESDNVAVFNKKIYDEFSKGYSFLKNNEEKTSILYVEYEYTIYNGLIGIIIFYSTGEQFAGFDGTYYDFYYDIGEDKEITSNEYLSKLGLSKDIIQERISKTQQFVNAQNNYGSVDVCILDNTKTVACCEAPESIDGWLPIETDPII